MSNHRRGRTIALAAAGVLVLGGIALAVVARGTLTGDNVRAAVAAQMTAALGQPVTIGAIEASIYPRVTMSLRQVVIGQPAAVELQAMHVGTDLRALFSRRIEHADVLIDGARLTMPLPAMAAGPAGGGGGTDLPVEIVSVDAIVLRNVEVVRGTRTLVGDIDLVPQEGGLLVRRIALTADDTRIEMKGAITSFAPLEGRIETTATDVDLDRLIAFLGDFAATPAGGAPAPGASPSLAGMSGRLTFDLTLGRASTGGLALTDLRATALVTPGAITFDPAQFGVFGGRYEGAIQLTLGGETHFGWRAKVSGVDAGALMAYAGSPGSISGTLAGTIALEGNGLEMDRALKTSRGTARVDITDGLIAGLSLVRSVVVATSGRGGYATSAAAGVETRADTAEAERFSRLGATLSLANGVMTTRDVHLASTDVDLTAAGTVRLATLAVDLGGQVQLSPALSQKSGTDLYRYTQQDGRVTLPVTVTGSLGQLSVGVDIGQAAMRAFRNRAAEEMKKTIERNLPGLGGLFPKKPPR